jgi:predicted AlkP superfamily phosphohydrolase/phosphomutase
VLPDVYAALDDAVGKIFDACPDLSLRLVLSDHGMGSASRCVIHLNRWLEQEGFLVRRGGLRHRAVRAVRDAAVRHLPRELQARLFRAFRGGLAATLESSFRLGDVDLERSTAFSEESSTLPGIWLLDPTALDSLLRRLRAWDGVVRAWRRDDRYRGPLRHRAPDILLELAHSSVKTPPDYRGAAIRRLCDAELDGERGAGLNGVHRPEGVLLAAGIEVKGPQTLYDAWIGDLAPSLLTALDVPVPGWMEGRALDALPGAPRFCDAPAPIEGPRLEGGLSRDEAARVERRLRALGYLG